MYTARFHHCLCAHAGTEDAALARPTAAVGVHKSEAFVQPTKSRSDFGTQLHDTGEIQAIDATGMDRIAASQHYAKRTNYTFRAVSTTPLIDCETGSILDIHCSMKQPHDTQIAWQLLMRNLDELTILTADKGYDW